MMAGQIGQPAPMDQETVEPLWQFAKKERRAGRKIETVVVASGFVCYNEDGVL